MPALDAACLSSFPTACIDPVGAAFFTPHEAAV
jgi:hypothetical protein